MPGITPGKIECPKGLRRRNLYVEGVIEEYNRMLDYYQKDNDIPSRLLFYRYHNAVAALEMVYRMMDETDETIK